MNWIGKYIGVWVAIVRSVNTIVQVSVELWYTTFGLHSSFGLFCKHCDTCFRYYHSIRLHIWKVIACCVGESMICWMQHSLVVQELYWLGEQKVERKDGIRFLFHFFSFHTKVPSIETIIPPPSSYQLFLLLTMFFFYSQALGRHSIFISFSLLPLFPSNYIKFFKVIFPVLS